MNSIQILTESDINNIDVKSQLELQICFQKTKDSGWLIDGIDSMRIGFNQTYLLKGSSYGRIPLRSSAILKFENNDKYYFSWTNLAQHHVCENSHLTGVKIYRQYFNGINFQGFHFTNGFKSSGVHKFEKLINLSDNILKVNSFRIYF